MKKLFSLIIAAICAAACVCSFVACGSGNTDNTGKGKGDGGTQTVAVQTVTIDKPTLTLEINGTETLKATVKPDNATNKAVAWSSDNPNVAAVASDGKVTAVAAGTATIIATAGGKSDTCTVTVNETEDPNGETTRVQTVTLNKSTLALEIDGTETLTATVKPDNATNKAVSWTSDKPEIARVENNGKVTAVAAGTAKITATADGKSDVCTVTVNAQQSNNPYAELTEAIEQLRGSTVLTYFENGNRLSFYELKNGTLNKVMTSIKLNTENLIESIKNVSLSELDSARFSTTSIIYNDAYTTTTAFAAENVQAAIDRYAGDGYEVIYGSYSNAVRGNYDTKLGADPYSRQINALLVKDGSLYIYSNTVVANSSNILTATNYYEMDETFTSLGEVAADYWAECNK